MGATFFCTSFNYTTGEMRAVLQAYDDDNSFTPIGYANTSLLKVNLIVAR
jgi:hypothetical protein